MKAIYQPKGQAGEYGEWAAKEALQDKNSCACFMLPSGERAVCVYHTILETQDDKCEHCDDGASTTLGDGTVICWYCGRPRRKL